MPSLSTASQAQALLLCDSGNEVQRRSDCCIRKSGESVTYHVSPEGCRIKLE